MTSLQTYTQDISVGADYEKVANKYRPIFAKIAEGALFREQSRSLPYEQIQWLKQAGFGAVRVPVHQGGDGVSIPQLIQLLIELSAADSNIPQALRGHFAFVEDRLIAHRDHNQEVWFKRFVAGDIAGNAWTEVGAVKIGDVITRVSEKDGKLLVNGQKYYTTGSIFADWLDLFAQVDGSNENAIAAVRTNQAGLTIQDDWDGFGQRTTGSGTAILKDVEVSAENIIAFDSRFKYQTAFYQLVLLAVLAGTGIAAVKEFSQQVKQRTRIFSTGNAASVDQDVQVQQVIGKASAQVYAAQATAVKSAVASQWAYEAHFSHQPDQADEEKRANIAAELESAQGQVVIADLILQATSNLFNALSASASSSSKGLDRFWRNARTAASHNPIIYKEKIIGDWEINGTEPPYVWQIGGGAKQG